MNNMDRFFIRSVRIITGVVAGALVVWIPAVWALDTLAIPFAQQSFLGLVMGIFAAGLAIGLFFAAWEIAFGEGETEEMRNVRLEIERDLQQAKD